MMEPAVNGHIRPSEHPAAKSIPQPLISDAEGSSVCILTIGNDPSLLQLWQYALESHGYTVRSFTGQEFLNNELMVKPELAILCHTLHGAEKTRIARKLQASNGNPRILSLDGPGHDPLSDLEETPDATFHPKTLLLRIDGMLRGRIGGGFYRRGSRTTL